LRHRPAGEYRSKRNASHECEECAVAPQQIARLAAQHVRSGCRGTELQRRRGLGGGDGRAARPLPIPDPRSRWAGAAQRILPSNRGRERRDAPL